MTDQRTLRARTVLGWVTVAVAVVAGLSILVGFAGPKKGFQWELASIFGTALGTTLLAAATGALAYSTWSDVRATWRLADLTKRDQDERQRPVLLLTEKAFEGSVDDGYITVQVRNVGLGPALRVEIVVTVAAHSWAKQGPIFTATNRHVFTAIVPGEADRCRMPVHFEKASSGAAPSGGDFAISGTFTDRSQQLRGELITDWQTTKQNQPEPFAAAW